MTGTEHEASRVIVTVIVGNSAHIAAVDLRPSAQYGRTQNDGTGPRKGGHFKRQDWNGTYQRVGEHQAGHHDTAVNRSDSWQKPSFTRMNVRWDATSRQLNQADSTPPFASVQ